MSARSRTSAGAHRVGLVGLAVALVAAGVLSADHLELLGEHLPGCGPESGCAQLTRGPWGVIPGLEWPTAHLGLAVLLGLLVTWIGGRGRPLPGLRAVLVIGALASVGLLGVMLVEGALCPWCLTVHAGNLLFVASAWSATRAVGGDVARGPLVAGAVVVVLASAGLAWAQQARGQVLTARRMERLAESTAEILEGSRAARDAGGDEQAATDGGFSGRWVTGPADAPIQVVLFADYQCPDCNRIEKELLGLLASRGDLSLSIKHFPLGRECNPSMTQDRHPNACRAARVAEAAGELGGNDGFWRMHEWLVEQGGDFSQATLVAALPSLGFDAQTFLATADGDGARQRVADDIAEASALGLHVVPMVFVNGVEMREVRVANAVTRVVEALAADLGQGATPTLQAPPPAPLKCVEDWRSEPWRPVRPTAGDWSMGAEAPAVDVFVWGDYGQELTRLLDELLVGLVSTAGDVRYTYRHYPLDPTCNDLSALRRRPPGSCRLAALAEAAGRLAGADGFWRTHRWLFSNPGATDAAALAVAAGGLGLDPGRWSAEAASTRVQSKIADDVRAGRSFSVPGVPTIFVNGRRVPRWRLLTHPDVPVLAMIFDAAREAR